MTYKENVADTRDNPVAELIKNLKDETITVYGYDPLLTQNEIADLGVIPLDSLERPVDGFVLAVPHTQFLNGINGQLWRNARPDIIFVDIKGIFYQNMEIRKLFRYITL